MEVFKTRKELKQRVGELRAKKRRIGYVPTMGALHDGHLSLVCAAAKENDIVVVSIFVNPTQFNNPEDLKKYPRNTEKDLQILKKTVCDIVYLPEVADIYPDEESFKTNYSFGKIVEIMEGLHRPGHFDGVALVVGRLFNIVEPHNAYFGQKDFQQFILIKTLAEKYLTDLHINVHRCPIVREHDGLAMSSRNALLNTEQRKSAALISKILFHYQKSFQEYTVAELKLKITSEINEDKNLELEYIEIVSDPDLDEINEWGGKQNMVACVAVQVGKVRLIDNVYLT